MSQSAGPHSVDLLIGRIDEAVGRVSKSATALSDEQITEPCLLPGWTRGHVLTHIARNADGLANLLSWAKTGEETRQYASLEARQQDIAAGAGRPAGEIAADIASSAKSFTDLARELPEDAWLAQVRMIRGSGMPAWSVLGRRLFEVEVHHVDLGCGYRPDDWPEWFVTDELYRITGGLTQNPEAPSVVLNDGQTGRQYFVHADATTEPVITGAGYALLAWLLGRDGGEELSAIPDGPLPGIPAYG